MSETLKPCPFCSGEASLYEEIPGGYIVQCHDCCAQVGIMTKKHAIAAWNARVPVEYDGWFLLPKPKEAVVQYLGPQAVPTADGYKVQQPVEIMDRAIRSWGDELGKHVMERICEVWGDEKDGGE